MLEAVCILKGVKPIRMKDTNTGQMVGRGGGGTVVHRPRLLARWCHWWRGVTHSRACRGPPS